MTLISLPYQSAFGAAVMLESMIESRQIGS